jgi:hypothetical protein
MHPTVGFVISLLAAASAAQIMNVSVTVDDSSPLITYNPPAAWTHKFYNEVGLGFYNNTESFSLIEGSYFSFTFQGRCLVFGEAAT